MSAQHPHRSIVVQQQCVLPITSGHVQFDVVLRVVDVDVLDVTVHVDAHAHLTTKEDLALLKIFPLVVMPHSHAVLHLKHAEDASTAKFALH